jgi:general secretion pathway protein K
MNRQRGIALVVTLWGVLLLAVLTGTVVALSRTETRLVESHLMAARHAAAVHSAVAWATQHLLATLPGQRLPIDGSAVPFEFDGQSAEISATLEAGRIDLNRANDELIDALFRVQGITASDTDQWVAKLRDWQDEDGEHRPRGAKFVDYQAAGLSYGPRSAPLKSIDELQLILGMPRHLAACLAVGATVYTGSASPDMHHLTPAARAALAWLDQYGDRSRHWLQDNTASSTGAEAVVGQVIRLRIRSSSANGGQEKSTEVIGRLVGGPGRAWLTIAERADDADDDDDTGCATAVSDPGMRAEDNQK